MKTLGILIYIPVSLTTTLRDFNKSTATTNTSEIASYSVPVVLVIKKNSRTLANLIDWLKEHSTGTYSEMVDQPMLLIDDEADNDSEPDPDQPEADEQPEQPLTQNDDE